MEKEAIQDFEKSQAMSSISLSNNQVDALLVLRAFACFMVVVIHCIPSRKSIIYQGLDLSWVVFSNGYVAVWIFFTLSGYLMGKAFYTGRYLVSSSGIWEFWRNRALRIAPLYFFALLILCFFVYPDMLKSENWVYLLKLCTFTYAHDVPINFNSAFWSLSTEVQFYFFIPFIYILLKDHLYNKQKFVVTTMAIVGLVFIIKLIFIISMKTQIKTNLLYAIKYWYSPMITSLDVFLIGFLVNPFLQLFSKSLRFPFQKQIAILLIGLLYLYTAHHLYYQELFPLPPGGIRTSTTLFILQPLTALITAFFIQAFESPNNFYQTSVRNRKLSFSAVLENPWRSLEIFGNLSYGIYIWHFPLLATAIPRISNSNIPIEGFYLRLVTTLLLSTVMATVTYYLVELPAAQWKSYRLIAASQDKAPNEST